MHIIIGVEKGMVVAIASDKKLKKVKVDVLDYDSYEDARYNDDAGDNRDLLSYYEKLERKANSYYKIQL